MIANTYLAIHDLVLHQSKDQEDSCKKAVEGVLQLIFTHFYDNHYWVIEYSKIRYFIHSIFIQN
jgi:hypothetical protein